MRVLVTGGCGYVGSHAVRALTAAGHDAVIYDNLSTGHRRFSDGYRLIEADIADESALALALLDVDAVMHFARIGLCWRVGHLPAKILPQQC